MCYDLLFGFRQSEHASYLINLLISDYIIMLAQRDVNGNKLFTGLSKKA